MTVALLQACRENQWHRVASSHHQGHFWQIVGAQTQSLCISSADDAPGAGISVRAWTGERNESFTDYVLMEIHNSWPAKQQLLTICWVAGNSSNFTINVRYFWGDQGEAGYFSLNFQYRTQERVEDIGTL